MSQYRIRMLALLTSLLLHLLFMLLTWNLDFIRIDESAVRDKVENIVELFLVPDDMDFPDPGRPTTYTSVPERHEVETPPDNPDFLALRHSEAADLLPGGEDDSSPGANLDSDITQVAIRRFEPGLAADGVTVMEIPEAVEDLPEEAQKRLEALRGQGPDESMTAESRAGEPDADAETGETEDPESTDQAEDTLENGVTRPELTELPSRTTPSILERLPGSMGDTGFDYKQLETGAAGGNMVRFGDYQLNTIAWEFAPWLEQFRRDFIPHWYPPYAYLLGVISGQTTLRLVVEMDGTIGGLETVDRQGHESLHNASKAALRSAAPYAPLPDDFPEENLVIILSLHYPAWSQ